MGFPDLISSRTTVTVIALFACLGTQGCGTFNKVHSQFGVVVGNNYGDEPLDFSETQAVAELGYVPGALRTDTPRWSFGGTAYLLLDDPMRPGMKAIARHRFNRQVSLDFSAGPMITYDSSGLFNGFTGGIALNVSFLTLRSEYVSWPFDPWDEYHYNGDVLSIEHHPSGREQVWFNGVAFNGAASWWAFAVVAGLLVVAASNGAFE